MNMWQQATKFMYAFFMHHLHRREMEVNAVLPAVPYFMYGSEQELS